MTYEEAVKTGLTMRLHQNYPTYDYDVMLPNGFTTTDYAEALSQMILQGVPSLMDLGREFTTAYTKKHSPLVLGSEHGFTYDAAVITPEPWTVVPVPISQPTRCLCPTLLNGHWPDCKSAK